MSFSFTGQLSESQKQQLLILWNKEYPSHLQHNTISNFDAYLDTLVKPNHVFYCDYNGKIKGWYVDFTRDNERWFAMILSREVQGKGIGSQILTYAKDKNKTLNGWVINHNNDILVDGSPYNSPLQFYIKNGFELMPNQTLLKGKFNAIKISWSIDSALS